MENLENLLDAYDEANSQYRFWIERYNRLDDHETDEHLARLMATGLSYEDALRTDFSPSVEVADLRFKAHEFDVKRMALRKEIDQIILADPVLRRIRNW